MANPQIEEGFTRIANELYDAILEFGFTGRQLQVVLAVIRKTYGYNKKADDIGLSQFRDMIGMARQHVSKTIQELAAMNVLKVDHGKHAQHISLNKNYRQWTAKSITKTVTPPVTKIVTPVTETVIPVTETVTVTESVIGYHQNGDSSVTDLGTTIDNSKDNSKRQKDIYPSFPEIEPPPNVINIEAPKRTRHVKRTGIPLHRFEEFWELYDKKVGRGNAEYEWRKVQHDDDLVDRIISKARLYVKATPDKQYRKHPTTWLHNKCWDDEIIDRNGNNGNGQPRMTAHQASIRAAGLAIFGNLEEQHGRQSEIIDVTPKAPTGYLGSEDI